ncbi:MAG: oligosaccharide flippase family protein, partial [Bacilli bacterium]|nr:oligosaccharide flippase family protein [Bacilli bacterium]
KKIENIFKSYYNKIKKSDFYKGLFKNSFWAFMGDSTAAVINLVVTIILIRLIGDSNFGILVLTQTYMQIIDVILNVQSWKSVIQFGQKAIVEKNKEKLLSYIKLGVSIDVITAIIGGVVAILIAPLVGHILGWSKEAITCAMILSVTIFSHLSGTSTALLRIFDKFHLVAMQKFFTAFIKLVSLLVLLLGFDNVSLITATIVYGATDIVGNILLVVFAIHEYKKKYHISELIKTKLPADKKAFTVFTLWSTLSDITDIPVNYLDVFIISLLGTKMVAVFKVFKQCIAILKKVTSAIQQAIMPQFSELVASDKKKESFRIVKRIRNVILKIMIPFGLIIGLTGPIWLKIFFGKLYASKWYVLLIYLLVQIVALSFTAIHPLYISLNKVREDTLIAFISNVIYFLIAYILVRYIGMLGIVIAFAIQSAIMIIVKYYHIGKIVGVRT